MSNDGSVTISTSKNINTDILAVGRSHADGITYNVTAITEVGGVTVITTSGSPDGIVAGDEFLVICTQGRTGNVTNVGNYELLTVDSVLSNVITCTALKTKYYGTGVSDDSAIGVSQNLGTGSGASGYPAYGDADAANDNRVVIQRVPNYTVLTIEAAGTLTCATRTGEFYVCEGTTSKACRKKTLPLNGGIVAFKARKLVLDGNIDVSGKGFQGASARSSHGTDSKGSGFTGESIDAVIWSTESWTVPNAAHEGAGGGGVYTDPSGGSAGYGTVGGSKFPGQAYGTAALLKLFFGSGAGSLGVRDNATESNVFGGSGGGIIYIDAIEISGNGNIKSNGSAGSDYILTYYPGSWGGVNNVAWMTARLSGGQFGGSGGSIFIYHGRNIPSTISLEITGGVGSYASGGIGRSLTTLKAEEALGGGMMLL